MAVLWCALVGVKGVPFSVPFDLSESVYDVKTAIKHKQHSRLEQFDADELELYLARTSDCKWLQSESEDAKQLYMGTRTAAIEAMLKNPLKAQATIDEVFHGALDQARRCIHVLVVAPEPATLLVSTQMLQQRLTMATTELLRERERCVPEFSIPLCTRLDAEKLLGLLGYQYNAIETTEEGSDSIDPYHWLEDVSEDDATQREGYMQYFHDNLGDVLHLAESTASSSAEFHLKDTSQSPALLDCYVPQFAIKGTATLMIIDDAAAAMNDVFAGLRFVINVKKGACGTNEHSQLLCQLVSASLKSEKRCAPVGLLTNLADYWYFNWIAPNQTVARMVLRDPASAMTMVKALLAPCSASHLPPSLRFLNKQLPKRMKLTRMATDEELAAAEMMERYELMADELDPAFLRARRIEYHLKRIRGMAVHSGMFS